MTQDGPETSGRPQDQGRSHARRGRPSAATLSLLARYQDAMRVELAGVLVELAGAAPAPGLLDDAGAGRAPVVRPSLADRMKLWDLAIKLGRELGAEVDPMPVPKSSASPAATGRPRRRRVDFG